MRQVEVSRTIVLDAPRNARAFFEALVADNLDLGLPENVELIFGRAPKGRSGRPVPPSPTIATLGRASLPVIRLICARLEAVSRYRKTDSPPPQRSRTARA